MGDTVINWDAVFDDTRPPDQDPYGGHGPSPSQGSDNNLTAPRRLSEPGSKHAKGEPVELSYDERIEIGFVNPGWTAEAWRDRLLQLAERCEAIRPDLATDYRRWARNIRPSNE